MFFIQKDTTYFSKLNAFGVKAHFEESQIDGFSVAVFGSRVEAEKMIDFLVENCGLLRKDLCVVDKIIF